MLKKNLLKLFLLSVILNSPNINAGPSLKKTLNNPIIGPIAVTAGLITTMASLFAEKKNIIRVKHDDRGYHVDVGLPFLAGIIVGTYGCYKTGLLKNFYQRKSTQNFLKRIF